MGVLEVLGEDVSAFGEDLLSVVFADILGELLSFLLIIIIYIEK